MFSLKAFCEIFVSRVLPAIRAIVAERLIEKYKLTQMQAASKMGLTQAAVSHYLRAKRGAKAYKLIKGKPEIMEALEALVDEIYEKGASDITALRMCEICEKIRKNEELLKSILKSA